VILLHGTINASEKWLSCSGTFGGGTGVGDEAEQAGMSSLLLSPVQVERSVGVSGLAILIRVIIQLLVAQLFIRLMACSFPVLLPVSSARPARNPTPISKITGTLQWLLGQPSTPSPCLRRQSFSGILFSSKMSWLDGLSEIKATGINREDWHATSHISLLLLFSDSDCFFPSDSY
jgi:hypothetical protein